MGRFLGGLLLVAVLGVAGFIGWGWWMNQRDGAPGAATVERLGGAPKAAAPAIPAVRVSAAQQAFIRQINGAAYQPPAAATADGPMTTEATGTETAPGQPAKPFPYSPSLLRAQVLLDRAGFSTGAVDGRPGSNQQRAIRAFAASRGLQSDGTLTPEIFTALSQGAGEVVTGYALTQQDVAGPFYPYVGDDLTKARDLEQVGYVRPTEALAERFHMHEGLLAAMNPGADFTKAGTVIVVVRPDVPPLPQVARIEVDKADAALRAYDAADTLIARLPATVGSSDRPSPTGTHKVNGVARNPDYTYDPAKLTWGPRDQGKFVVKPGPNNPVGLVWIDLDAPSYGLHGSPEPEKIGKTASHGCVRLTNWDALRLAAAVKGGIEVTFVNARG